MAKVDLKRTKEELNKDKLSELSNFWGDDPRERFNKTCNMREKMERDEVHVIGGIIAVITVVAVALFCTYYDKY